LTVILALPSDNCSGAACHENASCSSITAGYKCSCIDGYVGDGINVCADVDECHPAHRDEYCSVHGTCSNTLGSYECDCNDMYIGNGIECNYINYCKRDPYPCHESAVCTSGPDLPQGFDCVCPAGHSGFGFVGCSDVDECLLTPCHSNATCDNVVGSFNCTCVDGYAGNGTHCDEVNECDSSPCHSMATCENLVGKFECKCNSGWQGNGLYCIDINECFNGTICHDQATCTNTFGSYECNCTEGWSGDGKLCIDDDQCAAADDNNCDANSVCVNLDSGYRCDCNEGYVANDDGICVQLNECEPVNPCGVDVICTDTDGSYECSCDIGYVFTDEGCADINECEDDELNDCIDEAICNNNNGNYTCSCQEGYYGDAIQFCSDVKECASYGLHNCDANALCEETLGSYTCSCYNGYVGDGRVCGNINECVSNTHNCHTYATCFDNAGSYECYCNAGYNGDGRTSCIDEKKCMELNCDENGFCAEADVGNEIVVGCKCNAGYHGDGKTCNEHDECTIGPSSPCVEHAICTNTISSYTCTCNDNYIGDGNKKCHDLDECATDATNNCHPNAICTNTDGGYTCKCWNGYGGDGYTCNEINECDLEVSVCHNKGDCLNTYGSYMCTGCANKYVGQGYHEYGSSNDDANPVGCRREQGRCPTCADRRAEKCFRKSVGYGCVCRWGFTLVNGKCEDINECVTWPIGKHVKKCGDYATCINTYGYYECHCWYGYYGDGIKCKDIDECAIGHHNCDPDATCTNTGGSFTCECHQGYIDNTLGKGLKCTDIDECYNGENYCHDYANCTNTPGSFECACLPTFNDNSPVNSPVTMVGFLCECDPGTAINLLPEVCGDESVCCGDVDECADSLWNNCDNDATCTNTATSYTCACNSGYIGDGASCFDQNECASVFDNNCHDYATCTNTAGTYTCQCNIGYNDVDSDNPGQTCVDIEECTNDTHDCDNNAICYELSGSFECVCDDAFVDVGDGDGRSCDCPSGYLALGFSYPQTCYDINECATISETQCPTDGTSSCVDTDGSYICECNEGYADQSGVDDFPGSVCANIDECATEQNECHTYATCTDTDGSYDCECNTGFTDMGGVAGTDCECSTTGFGISYTNLGTECVDIDECSAPSANNCHADANCTNVSGDFHCECNAGYEDQAGTDTGTSCLDIDECNDNPCSDNTDCTNAAGTYTCACSQGYSDDSAESDASECNDIDECDTSTLNICDSLHGVCTNSDGAYSCSCPDPIYNWDANGDGSSCQIDVDECDALNRDFLSNCDIAARAICTNTIGGHECECRAYYPNDIYGDGSQCDP
jgi:hypothetical protein